MEDRVVGMAFADHDQAGWIGAKKRGCGRKCKKGGGQGKELAGGMVTLPHYTRGIPTLSEAYICPLTFAVVVSHSGLTPLFRIVG